MNSVCNWIYFSSEYLNELPALDHFKSLKSSHEQMDFVMKYLKEHIDESKIYHNKNDDLAIRYRRLGNKLFVKKVDLEALKMYTKSIAYAKPGRSSLSLAYANRSAVLFQKKYYRECLEDITRAIQNHYPEELMEKLLKRQEQAKQLVIHQELLNYHHPVPTIENKNPHIQAASDLIEIRRSESLGQDIVVAAKDITGGDILIIEKPYVNVVEAEQKYLHCCECLELCFNLIPCNKCTEALYCSDSCKQEAYTYHKYECVLFYFGFELVHSMYFNLILKSSEFFKKGFNTGGTKKNFYRSDRLEEILKLKCPVNMNDTDLLTDAFVASTVYWILKERTDFFKGCNIEEKVLKDICHKLSQIAHIGYVNIPELRKTSDWLSNDIGKGIYPFLQKTRSACVTNTTTIVYGSWLVMRSLHNIKKGEEIFHGNSTNYLNQDLLTRQRILKDMYVPDCLCRPCVERWPTYDKLPSGPEVSATLVSQFNIQNKEIKDEQLLNTLMPEALQLYDSLKQHGPNKNLVMVARFIRLTYKLRGNVMIDF